MIVSHFRGCVAPALALAAACVAALGFGVAGVAFAEEHTNESYTIDVDESGFTPGSCQTVDRPVTVRFHNLGTVPRRVIVPDVFPNQPPLWSSGVLQPGDTSTGYVQIFAGRLDFIDSDDASHVFSLSVPKIGPGVATCAGDPIAPPPTPAAGPTVPIVRCRGNAACNVAMAVASDR